MRRMLVVDDDELIVDLVKTILSRAGHEVAVAYSGEEALEMLDQSDFDLVVSDIFMSQGTGIELLIKMRARGMSTGFIAISGGHFGHFSPFANALQSMGVTKTLQKPFAPDDLLAAVDATLPKIEVAQ
jgi:DNA-binding NtrC family response regulator